MKKDGETTVETLELTAEEALELYNDCILPDMRDGTIGLVWLEADADYRAEVYDCCISMDLRDQDRGREEYVDYETFYTYATVFSERTNAWLAEHGITLDEERIDALIEAAVYELNHGVLKEGAGNE